MTSGLRSASGTGAGEGFRRTPTRSFPPSQLCAVSWRHRAPDGSRNLESRSRDAATKGEGFCSVETVFAAGGAPWLVGQEELSVSPGLFPIQVSTHVSMHSLGKSSKLARKAQSRTCEVHPCKVP